MKAIHPTVHLEETIRVVVHMAGGTIILCALALGIGTNPRPADSTLITTNHAHKPVLLCMVLADTARWRAGFLASGGSRRSRIGWDDGAECKLHGELLLPELEVGPRLDGRSRLRAQLQIDKLAVGDGLV